MIKEEYIQQDLISAILKKEEEGDVKIEESTLYSQCHSGLYNQKLTVPCSNYLTYSRLFPSSTTNFDIMNKFLFAHHRQTKPFKIIKEPYFCRSSVKMEMETEVKTEETSPQEKVIQINIKQKRAHVSACKNYIALLCLGISRTILTAESESQILSYITGLFDQKKKKFDSLVNQNNDVLLNFLRKHVCKTMCGKKIKKSRRKKDFKIRNTEELDNLLTIKQKDSEMVSLMKDVLRELTCYFFESNYFDEWLSNCMMSETNRRFFIKNKKEIQKKFSNPGFYKPHFSHNTNEEI